VRLGFVKNDVRLSRIYSAADILVMPSRQESFGQTALEAISSGTPVIGFDVGGVPDMVRHGDTGFLAQPEDTADLERWINRGLADEAARQRMAERCRRVAVKEYNLELQAKRYARLYEEMLERKPAAAGE
jgi:glycosyltransferase involved in cell wall biosynthesis